ncbi:MAG: hypothetical protein KC486_09545, partial [Myxococcales bacterium]|nr:hypothetical protein [Myxococcales bacterium]
IARAPSGATVTLARLFEAVGGGRPPLLTRVRSHLSDHLEAAGHVVLLATPDAPLLPLVAALGAYARVRDRYCMPLGPTLSRQEVERWRPLTRAAKRLLEASGAKIKALVLGHFDYPESAIAERVAIVQDEPWSLSALDRVAAFKDGLFARRQALVVNADHPTVADLVRLSQREPEQAGYMLAKSFLVRGDELDAEIDGELLRRALEMRCQRQTG